MTASKGEMTQPGPRELKEFETAFIEWLGKIRASKVPGGEKFFRENKDVFADTHKLWKITQVVEKSALGKETDLSPDDLRWLYDVIDGVDGRHPMLHGLNRSQVKQVIQEIQGRRFQKIFSDRQPVVESDDKPLDHRTMLTEHDMRKIFAPRDLGRIMVINNPNRTMDLEGDVNTLVGGFHNTVGYREKFGNKIFPNLKLIVGHAHFSNMKDLGNLEEVTSWVGFDNQISPEPDKIEKFAIKRIAGKDLTREDIRKIVSQELREFGKPKKVIQYSDL
ncbi:hypothetical protein HY968_04745 [Candidatus Kaiserbacteria bacterium]|nr:hypothetical protein [Candidatus Kaiserbacteria bacterium]